MGFAAYPALWQHLKCRMFFTVDADTGKNFRAPDGIVDLYCPWCKEWTQACEPNGDADEPPRRPRQHEGGDVSLHDDLAADVRAALSKGGWANHDFQGADIDQSHDPDACRICIGKRSLDELVARAQERDAIGAALGEPCAECGHIDWRSDGYADDLVARATAAGDSLTRIETWARDTLAVATISHARDVLALVGIARAAQEMLADGSEHPDNPMIFRVSSADAEDLIAALARLNTKEGT